MYILFLIKTGFIESKTEDKDENERLKYSQDDLLDKAESLVDELNFPLAGQFCQRALEMNPDSARALVLTASLLLESNPGEENREKARKCLGRAVVVEPDSGHEKFLTLAQLMSGSEALALYRKGVEIMSGNGSGNEREMSNAFCAIAELFMTDLCDEKEAETECGNAVDDAVKSDPGNPEAFQTKARLLTVKEDFEGAKMAMKDSLNLWLPDFKRVLEGRGGAALDPVNPCPLLYTTRIAAGKQLIELEMWDEASDVLDGLLEEDDEVVEVWYLLGWLNRLRDDEDYTGNSRFYLNKAKQVQGKNPIDDEEMVQHIDELLEELGPGDEDDGDNDEEQNWDDIASSSEDEQEEDKKMEQG